MEPLTFTVTEITDYEGYSIIPVQLGSTSGDVTCGDTFNITAISAIAALNAVDSPLVLSAP
jgi:hypothetical protein